MQENTNTSTSYSRRGDDSLGTAVSKVADVVKAVQRRQHERDTEALARLSDPIWSKTMDKCLIIFCTVVTAITLGSLVGWITNHSRDFSLVSELPPASVTVDASSNLTYRPIRALGDDWYLVEIAYPHTCENPFPFGKTMMVMVVPHLVRMHASELDKLDNPEK